MDYWEECIKEVFDVVGIAATEDQIKDVAFWVEGAHENYGMYQGYDCIPNPLIEDIKELEKELERERRKIHCKRCNGTGREVLHGPYHSSDSDCSACRGLGKVDP